MMLPNYKPALLTTVLLSLSSVTMADNACTELVATGNSEYPPYLWRKGNNTDELLGANRLIMDELAKRLSISIQLKDVGSWARAQQMARSGGVDMIAGAFFTQPRTLYMDYIYPAFLTTSSVVWRKSGGAFSYAEPNDLIGKAGVTVINNSFGQEFDEFAKAKLQIHQVASLEQAFKMVRHSRVDYALYEHNPGLAYAEQLGMSSNLEALQPAVSSEGLHLTLSHQSKCNTPELRNKITETINSMVSEGFMQKALKSGLQAWKMHSQ